MGADTDDDGDGVPDTRDYYPRDPTRQLWDGKMTTDPKKFHMKEHLGAKEDGFSGPIVQHDNKKTATHDWGNEYLHGASAAGVSDEVMRQFCRDSRTDNSWCKARGFS